MAAGGILLGSTRFVEPAPDQIPAADGAIGRDLLRGMAVGFDEFRREFALWPRGATPTVAEAEAWVDGLPAWDERRKPQRVKLGTLPGGAPSLELEIGGRKAAALLSLGTVATYVSPSLAEPHALLVTGEALFPQSSFGGAVLPWLLARSKDATPAVKAVLPVNVLGSRRVLADFSAGALYLEDLPVAAKLSKFLDAFTRAPVGVEGDGIFVRAEPGADAARYAALGKLLGLPAVRIAGAPVPEWLDALRGKDAAAAKRLAALLDRTFRSFSIDVETPVGERQINVPVPSEGGG